MEGEKLDEEEFVGTGEVVRIEKTEEVIVAMYCFCLFMCLYVFLFVLLVCLFVGTGEVVRIEKTEEVTDVTKHCY